MAEPHDVTRRDAAWLALACLAWLCPALQAAEAPPKKDAGEPLVAVVVTGESVHSFEAAKEDALRRAVEQGAGKFVVAQSHVRDFRLLRYAIVTRAAGYVRRFEVLERREADGVFRVTIRAWVATGRVERDWGALELLVRRKGRPNLLVVVEEKTLGIATAGRAAETRLRALLGTLGFDVVDAKAAADADDRLRVRAALAGDERKAAAVAPRLRANYLVVGQAVARVGKPRAVYGIATTPASASLDLVVVAADSAAQLASASATARRRSPDALSAARLALEAATAEAARQAVDDVVAHWARDLDAGRTVTATGTRLDTEVLDALVERLRDAEAVASVTVVDHSEELTTLKIVTRLDPLALGREIAMLSGRRLLVTGSSPGRVELKMRPRLPGPPRP